MCPENHLQPQLEVRHNIRFYLNNQLRRARHQYCALCQSQILVVGAFIMLFSPSLIVSLLVRVMLNYQHERWMYYLINNDETSPPNRSSQVPPFSWCCSYVLLWKDGDWHSKLGQTTSVPVPTLEYSRLQCLMHKKNVKSFGPIGRLYYKCFCQDDLKLEKFQVFNFFQTKGTGMHRNMCWPVREGKWESKVGSDK